MIEVRKTIPGQPLAALLLMLGGWIAVRCLLWDTAMLAPGLPGEPAMAAPFAGPVALASPEKSLSGYAAPSYADVEAPISIPDWSHAAPQGAYRFAIGQPPRRVVGRIRRPFALLPAGYVGTDFAELPLRAPPARTAPAAAPFQPPSREVERRQRWSVDSWVLLRGGAGSGLSNGPVPSTYGASQAGAVLRYRLFPESRHRPAAYFRTTSALTASSEREMALGIAARIVPSIPVVAQAEVRATSVPFGTLIRPAIMAVSELPSFALPYKLRGEAYAQAGYVGGRYATGFADGQLRVDRQVGKLGRAEVRAGGGIWGGAQRGASRLDVGPGATIAMGLDGVKMGKLKFDESAAARVGIDWRFRVAGDAAPASGPALTLSAGF
jgi:hypothetical protein